ncbi:CHAT domain-containing protein [bacterium]|nr:CHAT domain-containing protein [bacterium]RIK77326.1 MAG: hypothetical protein DCC62_09755 [candidate division KSB1 bacterium]
MSKIIKILFLAANPKDTTQLRLDEEMRSIDLALRQSEFRDRFDIEQQWAVRVSDLQSHLLRYKPDIVHFSGHGSEAREIILENNAGESQPVSSRALGQLFAVLKDNIRCVVLNACFSASQAEAIAQHIDCVVGMSQEIGDVAALSFASSFYQALGFGRDVKTAFDLGCLQIDMENLNEQYTPKLIAHNHNPKTIIFAKPATLSGETAKKPAAISGSSREYAILMTIGSACLCLIILVLGTIWAVLDDKISVEALGNIQAAGFGGGLLGFGTILYRIIKMALAGGNK